MVATGGGNWVTRWDLWVEGVGTVVVSQVAHVVDVGVRGSGEENVRGSLGPFTTGRGDKQL